MPSPFQSRNVSTSRQWTIASFHHRSLVAFTLTSGAYPAVASANVQIRRAGPGDIEPALAVMSEAFGLRLRAPTVHTLVVCAPEGVLLVAVDEGAVVGTAAAVGF